MLRSLLAMLVSRAMIGGKRAAIGAEDDAGISASLFQQEGLFAMVRQPSAIEPSLLFLFPRQPGDGPGARDAPSWTNGPGSAPSPYST
jgi:hypothetical protein